MGAGRSRTKAKPSPPPSVTAVAFLPSTQLLVSGSAQDTCVKFWDMRMMGVPMGEQQLMHGATTAGAAAGAKAAKAGGGAAGVAAGGGAGGGGQLVESVAYVGRPTRGVTHLDVCATGDKLLVTCTDGSHFILRTLLPQQRPLASYTVPAAPPSSWYTRSAFSPCGEYFAAGCGAEVDAYGEAQGAAYIWRVSDLSGCDPRPSCRLHGLQLPQALGCSAAGLHQVRAAWQGR